MEGQINVKIDYKKFNEDAVWDGLKGYITTTKLSKEEIIEQYNHLWQIEKAFRISKTDLKIRPIFHRLKKRIEAHICLSFCSYKLYKEFERQLKEKNSNLSVERAIELLKSIYEVTLTLPESGKKHKSLIINNEQQREILNLFLKS
jgi:transposase